MGDLIAEVQVKGWFGESDRGWICNKDCGMDVGMLVGGSLFDFVIGL